MEKPAVVAELKIGFDARSVDTSKFKGLTTSTRSPVPTGRPST
jgi:hypothetical protein